MDSLTTDTSLTPEALADFTANVLTRHGHYAFPSQDALRRAIGQEDPALEGRAVFTLARSPEALEPVTEDTLLEAFRKVSQDAMAATLVLQPFLERLDRPETLTKILAEAARCRNEGARAALWDIIEHAPLPFLEEHRPSIEAAARDQGVSLTFLEARRDIAASSPEASWSWLKETLADPDVALEDDAQERRASAVAQHLARQAVPSTQTLIELIESGTHAGTLFECFLIDILGKRPELAATACLFERWVEAVEEQDELIEPTAGMALAASPSLAPFAHARFKARRFVQDEAYEADLELLSFLSIELGRGTLATLMSVIETFGTRDPEVGVEAALALCRYPVKEALTRALEWAEKIQDRQAHLEMAEDLVVNHDLLGLPLPGRSRWEELRQEFEDQLADELEMDESMNGESSLPFVRESPKVGRNDPCPCGSGKKYKKCCMDS